MPRFFIDNSAVAGGYAVITGSDARHISLALRMRAGDAITLCDFSRKEYMCVIDSITPSEVRAKILSTAVNSTEPPYRARLLQALPKGDRADTVVQKSVECGISEIVFFESERCVAKLKSENAEKRLARFRSIALEAAKQCGRGIVPDVSFAGGFSDAIEAMHGGELCFICYEGDESGDYPTVKLGKLLSNFEKERIHTEKCESSVPCDIRFMIGPEGGFSTDEIRRASEAGLLIAGLGQRILRCETAAPFVLSCLSMRYELGG